ncbi:hypothetical protein [Catenulispora rubra]|uniref:hypothetical protein n=1 Tax=Catenulispora rubra TaxID=280293 RepID=UPI0018922F18|nr:hypothetical protein [Catenulispora rubra]
MTSPTEPPSAGSPAAVDGPGAPADEETGAQAPPRDYRLMIPSQGWTRIALDPEVWPRRIQVMVDKKFRGIDNAPHLKAEMRGDLERRCQEAWEKGGIELYLGSMDVVGVPVSASLLVTLIPRPAGQARATLEQMALGLAAEGRDARVTELPAGKALVQTYKTPPRPGYGSTFPDTHHDVLFDVPHTASQLLLSFSTPVEPLAEAMVELFESMALSFVWKG